MICNLTSLALASQTLTRRPTRQQMRVSTSVIFTARRPFNVFIMPLV